MWLRWGMLGTCAILSACAAPNNTSWWDGLGSVASSHGSNQFNFEWSLVGDQQAAPLHVFSSETQVWLQYPSTQTPPVVFSIGAAHTEMLDARAQGRYWVVDTTAKALQFQNGRQSAWAFLSEAEHFIRPLIASTLAHTVEPNASYEGVAVTAPMLNDHAPILNTTVSSERGTASVDHASSAGSLQMTEMKEVSGSELKFTEISATAEALAVVEADVKTLLPTFAAQASDQNLRAVLQRWAQRSGWTFEAEHWAVDVDLPITASFSIQGEFTEAVQAVVASTHLGTHPLKPCFYSNQVLRIVRMAQSCAPKVAISDGGLS